METMTSRRSRTSPALAFCAVLAVSASFAEAAGDRVLFDFSVPDAGRGWVSINDDVMGGRSRGGYRVTENGTLMFSGIISLENRGGFASIRSPVVSVNLSRDAAVAVRVRGDGRTYYMNMRTSKRSAAFSYRASFDTRAGAWQEIRLPLENFKPTAFGRELKRVPPLDQGGIQTVGFTLADKRPGPFKLEIAWVKAVSSTEDPGATPRTPVRGGGDIVDVAVAAGQFNTLVAAVKAAGFVDALKAEGPLTVFAPTDAAFEKLPKGALESLLKPENKAKLAGILKYHVVPGRVMAAEVLKTESLRTVLGADVAVKKDKGGVLVDGAKVVKTDIAASNGVIHVIDTVLIPKDVVDTAVAAGTFETLVAAVKAAGLVDTLKGDGPFTVFAPTDEAFEKLPEGTVDRLLRPENRKQLQALLTYHVVPGKLLLGEQRPATVQGSTVHVVSAGTVLVNNAQVVKPDILVANGVIHAIDTVLIPPVPKPGRGRAARDMIELAIDRGVPLFNSGNVRACRDIYELTARSLIALPPDGLSDSAKAQLRSALNDMARTHDFREQAWILRRALDMAYYSLQGRAH